MEGLLNGTLMSHLITLDGTRILALADEFWPWTNFWPTNFGLGRCRRIPGLGIFGLGRRILALAAEFWPWPKNFWPWPTNFGLGRQILALAVADERLALADELFGLRRPRPTKVIIGFKL